MNVKPVYLSSFQFGLTQGEDGKTRHDFLLTTDNNDLVLLEIPHLNIKVFIDTDGDNVCLDFVLQQGELNRTLKQVYIRKDESGQVEVK